MATMRRCHVLPCRFAAWIPSQARCPQFVVPSGWRGFAKKRKRLDEYDAHYAPGIRLKVWREVIHGDGFYPQVFEDMGPAEVSQTIFLASKMNVTNTAFWRRASLAAGDVAAGLSPKQLAVVVHAFGAVSWRDEFTSPTVASAVGAALVRSAESMRPGDLAVAVRGLARTRARRPSVMTALAKAAQENSRLNEKGFVMILEGFAALQFYSEGLERRLAAWAATGGLDTCAAEFVVPLTRALSSLPGRTGVLPPQLQDALSARIGQIADTLEPQELIGTVLSSAKMRLTDVDMVSGLERGLYKSAHRIHMGSIPALLDALSDLYGTCNAGDGSWMSNAHRKDMIALFTSRLTRHLRHLRPQDACRALQALDRIGVLDPHLIFGAARHVPSRLVKFPPAEVADLLRAYAKAGNADGFMVSCLRRALLPVAAAPAHIVVDTAPLAQIDDVRVVQIAEDFLSLGHLAGVLAAVAAVWSPSEGMIRTLVPTCNFVFAATVSSAFPSRAEWELAVSSLEKADTEAVGRLLWALETSTHSFWLDAAQSTATSGDALLLAFSGFPRHSKRLVWATELVDRLHECSLPLLPNLLLSVGVSDNASQEEILSAATEKCLLQNLTCHDSGLEDLPGSVLVACLRALAHRAEVRPTADRASVTEAVGRLVSMLTHLDDDAVDAKSFVRSLQALHQLQIEPSAELLHRFAERSASLSPAEFIFALKLLSNRGVQKRPQVVAALSAMATRVMALVKSSRQAWELASLCRTLDLDLGEVEEIPADESEEPQRNVAK